MYRGKLGKWSGGMPPTIRSSRLVLSLNNIKQLICIDDAWMDVDNPKVKALEAEIERKLGLVNGRWLPPAKEDLGWNAIFSRRMISLPGSDTSFNLIRKWIDACLSGHSFCETLTLRSSVVSKMPHRVLRVEHKDGFYTVALHEDPPASAKYVALSHCWGTKQPLTTTKETLASHKDSIPWESLPKTFQHAILITTVLGVEYIWIDSLCILQDDKGDWAMESAKMSSIYENAWLTIAAAAGPDGAYGCFPTSRPIQEYDLALPNKSGSLGKVYARRLQSSIETREHLTKMHNILPLFQRAWVLQERLLSRRILYLFEDEMAFECGTSIRCECSGPCADEVMRPVEGTDYAGLKYRYSSTLNQWYMHRNLWSSFLPFEPTGILEIWDHLVSQYTRRKLTYYSDRLPALSGIAATIYNTGALGRYYAGLWEVRLAECLLWYVDPSAPGFDPLPPTIGPSTAPSWSWASINGTWEYRRKSLSHRCLYVQSSMEGSLAITECKEFEVELHLASPNVFGAIELGKLSFKAPMVPAVVSYASSDPLQSYSDRFRDQKAQLTRDALTADLYADFVLDYGSTLILSGDMVQCVAIQNDFQRFHGLEEKPCCHSLVLVRSTCKDGTYRRVGKFLAPVGWFEGAAVEKVTVM